MTKRPSKFELYACRTLTWTLIAANVLVIGTALLALALTGETAQTLSSLSAGTVPLLACFAWDSSIENRQLRWAIEGAILIAERHAEETRR